MQHHHHGGAPLGVQLLHELQHVHLVGEVQEARRLVQHQDVGLLRQRHGDPHPLPLPAGERLHRPVGQREGVGPLHRLGHGGVVRPRCGAPRRAVRVPPAGDQLGHRQPRGHQGLLGQQPDGGGHLAGRDAVQVVTVEQHLPGGRAQQPHQAAQQGALPAPVGAHQGGDPAVGDLQRDAAHHVGTAVGERQVAADQACVGRSGHADIHLREVRSSASRAGPPARPVTTPTGTLPPGTR